MFSYKRHFGKDFRLGDRRPYCVISTLIALLVICLIHGGLADPSAVTAKGSIPFLFDALEVERTDEGKIKIRAERILGDRIRNPSIKSYLTYTYQLFEQPPPLLYLNNRALRC